MVFGSVALIRTDVTLHALRACPRIKAMRRSAAFAPQWLVLTGGATSSVRVTAHSRIARIGRSEVDHSALNASGAEECACRRGKLAELPAGIDPFQHQGDEGTLQIRTGRERASLEQSAVHVSHDNPAWLFRRLQRIEDGAAADHGENLNQRCRGRPSSSPQRSKLYGSGARPERRRATSSVHRDVRPMPHGGAPRTPSLRRSRRQAKVCRPPGTPKKRAGREPTDPPGAESGFKDPAGALPERGVDPHVFS